MTTEPAPVVPPLVSRSVAVPPAPGGTAAKPHRGRPRRGVPAVVPMAGATKVTAAVILEVLAGERSTSSAAALIGVSPVRYYAIESRAIAGLIAACAPRPAGAVPGGGDAERALRRAIADKDGLTAQVRRLNALLRSTQRSLGIAPVEAKPDTVTRADGRKPKRHRRPRVRALTLVRRLMAEGLSTKPAPAVTAVSGSVGG
jgi:hypothetical protein